MKFVVIYEDVFSNFEATGPFDSQEEAGLFMDNMIAEGYRDKDFLVVAQLKEKPA